MVTPLNENVVVGQPEQGTDQSRQLFEIPWYLSETEFLHGCESCPDLLCRVGGTSAYYRNKDLLNLWIKLGRVHPVILRRHLSGEVPSELVPDWVDRQRLIDFVDWSWASFNAVHKTFESESVMPSATSLSSVAEDHHHLDQ